MKNKDGNTVLDNAVYFGAHEAARIVLGLSGAPRARCYAEEVRETYRNVNHRGRGILHHLADHGDKEMMETFASVGMTGIPEPETFRDSEGKTAVDLFDERVRGVYGMGSTPTNGFRPAMVSKCSPVSEEKQRLELIRAWTELFGSVNADTSINQAEVNDPGICSPRVGCCRRASSCRGRLI